MATPHDFDLLTDAWIPVVTGTGERLELGLLDCLERAHLLREIIDPSPLVTYGIHRFLAAVVHAYLPLDDLDAWGVAWEHGCFAPEFLERVRQRCAGRLRLFDDTHPFYQTGDIPLDGASSTDTKTVGYIQLEESPTHSVAHFFHRRPDQHAYCPVCCARGLLVLTAFALMGGSGYRRSINGDPPIYVMPRGEHLFATLLLNSLVPDFQPDHRTPTEHGPFWEQDGIVRARHACSAVSFLDSLSWPARRVRLFPENAGTCSSCGRKAAVRVRRVAFGPGHYRQDGLPTWDDPWVAFRERPGDGGQTQRVPVRLQPARDVWRDFPGLFLARSEDDVNRRAGWLRPKVLRQIDYLLHEEQLPADTPMRFETFGVRVDRANILESQHDLFDFPPLLLRGDATADVQTAIQRAEGASRYLERGLLHLHPEADRDKPHWQRARKAMEQLITTWSRSYWHALELPFRAAIADPRLLGTRADRDAWLDDWDEQVRRAARDAFESALDTASTDADGLRRQQQARATFYGGLRRIFDKQLVHP